MVIPHRSMGQLIAVLFLAREIAHRAHLRATGPGSFAKHEALGEFYPAVVELADKLAEAYQGCELTLIDIPLLDNEFPGEILESLKSQRDWVKSNRYKAIKKDETHLHNIVDEVISLYDSTIYKLNFLE